MAGDHRPPGVDIAVPVEIGDLGFEIGVVTDGPELEPGVSSKP